MDYISWIEENKESMIASLQELVKIKSVQEEKCMTEEGIILPFGRGVEDAYQKTLSMGREFGFEVADFEHYGGHIEFSSEDSKAETFGIAAHLDVVPEGDGWTEHEPYSADIDGNYMYGRGTTDDKGPLVACLYAMKALKECGIKPKKNIRLILGLDEEIGQIGMDYYLDKAGMPDFGITPDGDFPVINGEMGIIVLSLAEKLPRKMNKGELTLRKLQSGTLPNIVPKTARAVIASDNKTDYDRIKKIAASYVKESGYEVHVRKTGSSLTIETVGISAHGAKPWDGLNATSIMMELLGRIKFAQDEINDFIKFYNEHIGFNLYGDNIGCGFSDEPSGKLIFNVGTAEVNEELASVVINIRYPVTTKGTDVIAGIENMLDGTKIGFIKHIDEKPIYIEEDDEFVTKLMEAYVEETGDSDNKPIVIGGGTYAKKLERTLAFGALFPGEEDRMHQADERINLESFVKYAKIYAKAIYKLTCE